MITMCHITSNTFAIAIQQILKYRYITTLKILRTLYGESNLYHMGNFNDTNFFLRILHIALCIHFITDSMSLYTFK
jgi:hypothetical protein